MHGSVGVEHVGPVTHSHTYAVPQSPRQDTTVYIKLTIQLNKSNLQLNVDLQAGMSSRAVRQN